MPCMPKLQYIVGCLISKYIDSRKISMVPEMRGIKGGKRNPLFKLV